VQQPRSKSKQKMPKTGSQSRSATCCSRLSCAELCSTHPYSPMAMAPLALKASRAAAPALYHLASCLLPARSSNLPWRALHRPSFGLLIAWRSGPARPSRSRAGCSCFPMPELDGQQKPRRHLQVALHGYSLSVASAGFP
jgi:hypothetical protein